jgi:signal transduction histidine kinase
VTDTGIGIPAEAVPHVFDRFFRVDAARSREVGGAGIGLSIVKAICTAHSGRVEVESEPGRGSRFRVRLALARKETLLPIAP